MSTPSTHAPPSGLRLLVTFLVLVGLAIASWVSASLGGGTTLALAIAAAKALGIALVFMELGHARGTERVAAAIAVFFIVLLCAGAVADVAFR